MQPNWQNRAQQQQQQRQREAMGAAWQQQQATQRRALAAAAASAATAAAEDPFSKLEAEAAIIRRDLASRRITQDIARSRLNDLMLQDAQGVWWMVGTQSGSWYRHDGCTWVPAARPGQASLRLANSAPKPGARATVARVPAAGPRATRTFGVPSFLAGVLVWGVVAFMAGGALANLLPGSGPSEAMVLGLLIWAMLVILSWRQHRQRMGK
ncbi:MAG: hypothetical protein R6X16_06480 [Anaerolineae bacterium]